MNIGKNSGVELVFLGTGTSHGVPMIGCSCRTCVSEDQRDQRTNSSVLLRAGDCNILIDCGRDFRYQAIRERLMHVEAILVTHNHFDHIAGLDDIRVFNKIQGSSIPIYGKEEHLEYLKTYIFHYLFGDAPQLGGGLSDLELHPVNDLFSVCGVTFKPLPIKHGKVEIYGYRFLDCAYLSDVSCIPDHTMDELANLDVLILDALRFRPHATHFNIEQALRIVDRVKPKRAYFTHICHDILYEELEQLFSVKESPYYSPYDVHLAYDGLRLTIR